MLHRLEFHAMGCEMLAVIECENTPAALSHVPEWFEEWEQSLSRFRYDSELTRLNQTHDQPIRVSEILWDVFQTARKAEQMTDGLVMPTLLDAIVEAGYDRPFDVLPRLSTPMVDSVLTISQPLTAIAFDDSARTITLPIGMGLDFGGAAKGWAAHQAMKRLQACPEQGRRAEGAVLINAGGDIAISGPRTDGHPWKIGIADPFHNDEELEVLHLDACGVATSGKDRRRWMRNGVFQHHIIDPLTGEPADTDLLTVTVVAPNVMEAEAAAKAVFILGSRVGLEWIEARPEYAGIFILDNGEMLYSRNMDQYVEY